MSSCYFVEPCTLLVLQLPGLDFSRRRLIHMGVSEPGKNGRGNDIFLLLLSCVFFPPSTFCWQSERQGSLAKIVYRLFLSLLLGEMLIKSATMKVDLLIFLCF